MDSHGSHQTFEFLSACEEKHIIAFPFLPHTTHFSQPLDDKPFLSYKQKFKVLNNHIIRYGGDLSDKRSFFTHIARARDKAFKLSIIRESFKNCGIWPFNPDKVLARLEKKVDPIPDLKIFDSDTTPPLESSSPLDSPSQTPRTIQRSVDRIDKYLQNKPEISPTYQRKIHRALVRGIANSNLVPLLQRELATAIDFKTQRERPKTKRQLSATGSLSSHNAKRQIKDREARERITAFRRERRAADKLADQQRQEQEILEKRRSGVIPPPDNPAKLIWWYDSVGDNLL